MGSQTHFDVEHHAQAEGDEDHADAQCGGDAEDGADHRCDLDGVSGPALGSFADYGVERALDRQRQVVAVGEEAERHTGQRVHRPAGDAVVEHGPQRSLLSCSHAAALGARADPQIGGGPDDGEEHQIGADAGGEEHGRPGEQTEPGLGMIRAKLRFAHSGQRDDQDKDHDDGCGEDEVPAQIVTGPVEHRLHRGVRSIGENCSPSAEAQKNRRGGDEYWPVDLGGCRGGCHSLCTFPKP